MFELSTITTYLKNAYSNSLGSVHDPMSFLGIGPLFVAFLLAFVVLMVRMKKKAGRREIRPFQIIRMLFPKRIFFHPSAKNDYKIFLINDGLLFFVTLSAIITPALFAEVFVRAFEAVGITTGEAGNSLWSKIGFTIVLLLAWDFGATYAHYLKHKVPLLWEFHKVHHSAEVMTPVTAMRRHPVDYLFGALVTTVTIGLALIGWTLVIGRGIEAYTIFGVIAGIYLWRLLGYNLRHSHMWISYGDFWNKIFISPAQHQVHHSTSVRHYDTNFGHIFSFWDAMLGTLYLPGKNERVKFGIEAHEMEQFKTLSGIYFGPFAKCAETLKPKARPQESEAKN